MTRKTTAALFALLTIAVTWAGTGAARTNPPVPSPGIHQGVELARGVVPDGVLRTAATPQDQTVASSSGSITLGGAYWNGSASCRPATAFRKFVNYYGYELFRYNERVTWCWNFGVIKSFYRERWPQSGGSLSNWQFDGNISSNCSLENCNGRGSGQFSATADTRGKFHACVLWWCEERYPYVSLTVYANGTATQSTSG